MDEHELHVRRLTLDDFAVIESDLDRYWVPGRTPAIHRMFVHQFGNLSFVAADGDAIAGFLMGTRSTVDPDEAYVHVIGTRDDHRRRGVAARLYAEFRQAAGALGIPVYSAMVRPANEASIAFHERQGMTATLVADHWGPGDDRLVFRAPTA